MATLAGGDRANALQRPSKSELEAEADSALAVAGGVADHHVPELQIERGATDQTAPALASLVTLPIPAPKLGPKLPSASRRVRATPSRGAGRAAEAPGVPSVHASGCGLCLLQPGMIVAERSP